MLSHKSNRESGDANRYRKRLTGGRTEHQHSGYCDNAEQGTLSGDRQPNILETRRYHSLERFPKEKSRDDVSRENRNPGWKQEHSQPSQQRWKIIAERDEVGRI